MSAEVNMIGEVPIFELMDDEEREALARMMDTRSFKQGETIFEYGDRGGEIFIVREGRVEVFLESTEGEKIVVAENERGDVLGELSFLDGGLRSATAVAVENTETLTMDRDPRVSAFAAFRLHRMMKDSEVVPRGRIPAMLGRVARRAAADIATYPRVLAGRALHSMRLR